MQDIIKYLKAVETGKLRRDPLFKITPSMEYAVNQLKNHPEQRCNEISECVEHVRNGSSVFFFVSK